MAKNRTEKSRYPSRYSPEGWVSASQYITELICEKKARLDKKELPMKFWEIAEWCKYYKYQIILANKLIKLHGEEVVVAALKDNRCWSTYSLRAPRLKLIIEEKEKEKVERPQNTEYNITDSKEVKYKTNNNQKSIISKLRDLDE
tara:strand:+ start:4994 stop:5428 length:435 start_codon:yes stop_codon:yes gene_type:complete